MYRYMGYNDPVSAIDIALAASALLDSCKSNSSSSRGGKSLGGLEMLSHPGVPDPANPTALISAPATVPVGGKAPILAFNEAYDCLSMKSLPLYQAGIQTAISVQKAIVTKAAALLERRAAAGMGAGASASPGAGNSIVTLRKMRFCYIREQLLVHHSHPVGGTPSAAAVSQSQVDSLFTRPLVLFKLGQHILEVQGASKAWRKPLPLVLLAEKAGEGTWVIVGILPSAIVQRQEEVLRVDKDGVRASDTVDEWARRQAAAEEEEESEEEEEEDGEAVTEEGELIAQSRRANKRRKLMDRALAQESAADAPPPLATGSSNFKKAFKWAKDRLRLPPHARYRDDCKLCPLPYMLFVYVYIYSLRQQRVYMYIYVCSLRQHRVYVIIYVCIVFDSNVCMCTCMCIVFDSNVVEIEGAYVEDFLGELDHVLRSISV